MAAKQGRSAGRRGSRGGPAGIRTQNQGIHSAPRFPAGVDYLFTLARVPRGGTPFGRGTLSPVIKGTRARAQPPGSLCTFRRCTAGLAQGCHRIRRRGPGQGSLNSSRPLRALPREGTFPTRRVDESPALTIELQARHQSSKRAGRAGAPGAQAASASLRPWICAAVAPSSRPQSAVASPRRRKGATAVTVSSSSSRQ